MKVAIIGAGSIGLLIGSYLAEADIDVTMVVRDQAQANLLCRHGIRRLTAEGNMTVQQVNATTKLDLLLEMDLCIVAVKYAQLKTLAPQLQADYWSVPFLFIQNGLAHVELIERLGFEWIAFASVEHGALRRDLQTVSHNGVGQIVIGHTPTCHSVYRQLATAACPAFPVTYADNVQQVLFRKALINCMINPLTTILRIPNGALIDLPANERLMRQVYDECMTAFPSMRTVLPFEDVIGICRRTSKNESSMLTDYKKGRPMEIETIVSAVIYRAKEEGEMLPLLQMLEQLLQALNENAYRNDR